MFDLVIHYETYQKSLAEHQNPNTLKRLNEADRAKKICHNKLFKEQEYHDAVRHHTEAIQRNPKEPTKSLAEHQNPNTLKRLNEADRAKKICHNKLFKEQEYHDAVRHHTEAIQRNPKEPTILTVFTYDEATPGLKAIVSAKVELQYLHPHVGICTSVGLTANPVVNFSGVIGTSVLALGTDVCQVSFDTESGNFKHFNTGVSFTKDDLIAALTLNDKGENTVVGAEVNHNLKSQVISITVGAQHSLDPLTTVKARVNNAGIANPLIQHEWRPKSFITIFGEVDSRGIEKSAKVGFTIALKP
ncbi:hypothetical protein Bca52824_057890 [Brassica carinata]|uniref:Uncharacterized protein n=1 Tax=Brassica carinata TaxID=52824 RepID=A0A8X7QVG2_BRACI|nr:hypothetical protein Bca52824_057890 [Brassica carinata]